MLIKINSLLELQTVLCIYKQKAFGEQSFESQSKGRKGGRSKAARSDERRREKGLRLPPSHPSPGRASLNQCVIAISRKVPFALNRADRGKEKTSLCNLQNLCKKSNNNKKQLFFFSPPLTLIIIFPKGRGLGWSSEPALANAPACSSQAPVTKPSLRQALQSASFTTNFPSCFLIKFSASFKYQSMNHLHFLQIPLKTLNQAIKRGAAQ